MYKRTGNFLLVAGLVSLSFFSFGQATQSPFTSRGIGDINDLGLVHNQAMGGLGISNGTYWYLNNVNPALLPYNSLTVFSAGLLTENRTISNSTTSEKNGGGSLAYLATAFPVKPGRWTTSLGLAPYSNVDYEFTFQSPVNNSNAIANITEAGNGGFTQFYWSNGYAINKSIFLGLKATYLFSSIESEFANELIDIDDAVPLSPAAKSRVSVSDFMFQGGIAYSADSIFGNKIKMNLGATYDFGADINATKFESTELQFNGQPVFNDTLTNDAKGKIRLPWALGTGLSFNNGQKWMAGIDFKYSKWSEYQDFDGNNADLDDSYEIILGGEFTPDPSSVSSYFQRVTYRVGFSYENTPYVINNKHVKDFGINFGWSLPVSRFSSLDMAFKYGRRGSISDTLIEEEYFRFYLGVTFNDQWFVKRKYD